MAELRRDWRRSGLLAALVVVALVLVIRQVSGTPSEAAATDGPERPAARARLVASAVPVSPAGVREAMSWMEPAGQPAAIPPLPPRDPFCVELEKYPPDPAAKVAPEPAETTSSQPTQAELAAQRAAALKAVQAEAGKLKLQSILMTAPPQAMISGEVYPMGARVGGFTLTQVRAGAIVLEKDGFEVVVCLE